MTVRTVRIALPAAAVLVCALTGCSSSKGKSGGDSSPVTASTVKTPSTQASAPSAPGSSSAGSTSSGSSDYAALLIAPSDIPVAGFTLTKSQAVPGAKGVTGLFANADDTRELGDSIVVLPNAAAAKTAFDAAVSAAGDSVKDAKVADLAVGDTGKLVTGTSGDGNDETAVAIFVEGGTFVTLQFGSKSGDTIPAEVIQQVAKAQDDKLKANPPS
jgi:hypothetical protein